MKLAKSKGSWKGDEDNFRDKLAAWLLGRNLRQTGIQKKESERAKITNVKINKEHPTRNDRPDIQIEHTGFDLGWRNLSNPFHIECKDGFGFQEDLLQLLKYKYDKEKEIGLEKYGQYHVGYADPKTVLRQNPFESSEYYSYPQFERTLWHLGLGLLKKGYHNGKLLLTFNEREQVVIL